MDRRSINCCLAEYGRGKLLARSFPHTPFKNLLKKDICQVIKQRHAIAKHLTHREM